MPNPTTDLRQRILDRASVPEGIMRHDVRNMVAQSRRCDASALVALMVADGALISVRRFGFGPQCCPLYANPIHAEAAREVLEAALAVAAEKDRAYKKAHDAARSTRRHRQKAGFKAKGTRPYIPAKNAFKAASKVEPTNPNNVQPKVIPTGRDSRHTFHPPADWQGGYVNARECRPWAAQVIRL